MKKSKVTVKGSDAIKHSGGFMPPAFRTGAHKTKKDRPRKKISVRDYIDE